MQEKKQEIYKIHCFYMGKIKKNDNLIIKDLMSSYQSRDLGYLPLPFTCLFLFLLYHPHQNQGQYLYKGLL